MKKIYLISLVLIFFLLSAVSVAQSPVEPMQLGFQATQDNVNHISIVPYDEQVYLLGYQAFLANRSLQEAYFVAKAAVAQKPDNIDWRKRLAQVATWSNQSRVALEQWEYIAKQTKDFEALKNAISIASMLNDHKLLAELFAIKIMMHSKDEEAWKGFILAKENLGDPQAIISELKKQINADPQLFYFEDLATIYEATGNITAELETLNEAEKRFGVLPKIALRQAAILTSQGKLSQAFQKLLAAYPKAKSDDYNFIKTFGQLAWLVQDRAHAKLAFERLVLAGQQDPISLINLIQMIEASDPSRAFFLAYQGWQKYHSDYFLIKTLGLGFDLKQWHKLSEILSKISVTKEQQLLKLPYYVAIKAELLVMAGHKETALRLYQQSLQKYPESTELKIDYLWFLIDHHNTVELKVQLQQWQDLLVTEVRLYPVFAAGYVELNDPQTALILYQKMAEKELNNPEFLLNVSGALIDMGRENKAVQLRRLAWYKMLNLLRQKNISSITKTELINLARAAMYLAPGDFAATSLTQLSRYYSEKEAAISLMTWALFLNEEPLAEYLFNYQSSQQDIPFWIQQDLALYTNDRYKLNLLLQKELAGLPHRDRVIAGIRIGNERLAQTLAFRGMEEHPNDSEMYSLMTDTQLAAADQISIDEALVSLGEIRGLRTKFLGKIFLTPRISLSPWANIWRTKTMNKGTILAARNVDQEYGFIMDARYQKGNFRVGVSHRQGLSSYFSAVTAWSYILSSKLNTLLSLGYHEPASETTALFIAGMKDQARFMVNYRIDQHDFFETNMEGQYFQSQDSVYLGNGRIVSGALNHYFSLNYPDWNASLYTTVNHYQLTGRVSRRAASVIPSGQASLTSFFLPRSNVRYGITFGFGQAYRETYTHPWRPFATVDLYNNNRFGFGNTIDIGIAGHVIGRDHLAIYYDRSTSFEAANQVDYTFGVSYQYYF